MRHLLRRLTIALAAAPLLAGGFPPSVLCFSPAESRANAFPDGLLSADAPALHYTRPEHGGPFSVRAVVDAVTGPSAIVLAAASLKPFLAMLNRQRPTGFHRPAVHLRL